MKKRIFLIFALGACAVLAASAQSIAAPKRSAPKNAPAISQIEPFLGSANAPVTLIEYGSMTCSHCAHFARDMLPTIKAQYIDTGKVKYIFRTLPTPPHEVSIAMQVVADCAGPRRFEVIDGFFNMQASIFAALESRSGVLPKILEVGRYSGGLSDDQTRQCINNRANMDRVIKIAQAGSDTYKINSTPSFVINGKLSPGPEIGHSLASLSADLDRALAARTAPVAKSKKAKSR